MHSNNDGMDPNFRGLEPGAFTLAFNKWYATFNGVPNSVHVKNFAHDYIKDLEKERAKLRAALERIAKIRTLPLTDSNDTDEELAAQYSSVIDILVHISREALSGREEGGG